MLELYRGIWRRRDLVVQLVRGQQQAAVHRMRLGTLWFTLVPLAQIMIYYFLVMVIFASSKGSASSFMLIAMGIMHYGMLTNTNSYVHSVVYNNSALLLQVKIEPLLLMAAGFLRTLRITTTGIVLFWIIYLIVGETYTYKLVYYPIILLAWVMLCWLIGITMSTIVVYVRDLEKLSPIFFQILMYASPVIYVTNMFPEKYQQILLLNPVASIFALFQWSVLDANVDITQPVIVTIVSLTLGTLIAHRIYRRGARGFTKVL